MVRHGFDGNALVRITPHNSDTNSDAYRPEQFGSKIILEKLIRRDGSGEYRLRDENSVFLVSKLRKDVEAMKDHLNIQTENPCALLDQDSAKLFLKGDPKDKYKFFLQATELDKILATFSSIDEETRNIAESTLTQEKVKLAALEAAMKEKEKQWQEAQSVGEMESELADMQAQLEWVTVNEKEEQVAKVEKRIAEKKCDANKAATKHAQTKMEVERLESRLSALTILLEESNQRMEKFNDCKAELKSKIRVIRGPLHQKMSEMTQLIESAKRETQHLARLRHALTNKVEMHETLLLKLGSADLQNRLHQIRRELAQTQQSITDAELRINGTSEEAEELEDRHSHCLRLIREAKTDIRNTHRCLSALKNRKTDCLAAYGKNISRLQQLIHAHLDRFFAPPIGPLGMYVTLPKEFMRFAKSIEVAFKGALNNYLVINGQDKKMLDDLKRQACCYQREAEVIIAQRTGSRYQNLNIAAGELGSHAICNILKVENDEVFNALIDVCNAESKLLFDSRETAERSILHGSSGKFQMERFVSEVYLANGDKLLVRGGNLAYIANKAGRRRPIICEDLDSEIKELEKLLDGQQHNLRELCCQESQLRLERDDLHRFVTQEKMRLDKLSHRYHQQYTELQVSEDEFSDLQQEYTLDTTLNAKEAKLEAEMDDPQRDATEISKHIISMKTNEIISQRQAEASQASADQLQQRVSSLRDSCEVQEKIALQACPRPAHILARNAYEKRMNQIQRQRARVHHSLNGLSLSELKNDMELKATKHKAKKANYDKFHQNLLQIQSMLKERKLTWDRLRTAISRRTSIEFSKYMGYNNFVGKLKFRHDQQRLEITVLQNDKGATSASQMIDMKELSGGERSYAQISLLLALGKRSECPFRIMDEFDVFMDAVNRDMTIQLLADAAKNEDKKQFILVTPNSLRYNTLVRIC
ncbi:unnamed protein product [Phytophthora fragariaefolia]|uniref:Unnamed protein product n=1 Tax=Phytophthora fragariaefolia TaxID=1490495 RepID=A0A9W6XZE2_9STRA|nr:unnamed protein product [Phytophthora fragariaefolia]